MSEAQWFSGRLRELREQAGLTQQQLGDRAGLTRDGIAQLERGRCGPSWETVVALVKALGVDANAFLQEPVTPPPAGPGRPRKPTAESADQQPKRLRGRPRKTPVAAEETAEKGKATRHRRGKRSPPRGKGHKRKGK